jgi:hypothetical protein
VTADAAVCNKIGTYLKVGEPTVSAGQSRCNIDRGATNR